MIKPKKLKNNSKIAIVSLSWGGLGDAEYYHKYLLAKERLEKDFSLEVITMPHALKGSEFVYLHPELRAQDLMSAFLDPSIEAIFCAIGGDDSIRLLPYLDLDVIRDNPKIFMGYSDTTVSHFFIYQSNLVSFYGPSIMAEIAEYQEMFAYTKKTIKKFLFEDTKNYEIISSDIWTNDYLPWCEENMMKSRKHLPELHGYEVLNIGDGIVKGHLLGGCLDVFMMIIGTKIWPTTKQWENAILFFETSEEKPSPEFLKYTLRNLAALGVLKVIKGIIIGKPMDEQYYNEYQNVIKQVILTEEKLDNLAIMYNVNIGHATPTGIFPLGIKIELNCYTKTIKLLESATI